MHGTIPRRVLVTGLFLGSSLSVTFGGETSINVNANVGGSNQQIGTLTVDDNDGMGGGITGRFELADEFAYLDEWYNFRWINIFKDYTVNGDEEDYDDDGNPDMPQPDFPAGPPPFIELPAIDPVAGPFAGGQPYNDDAPFYFTDEEHENCEADGFGQICEEGEWSEFSDVRSGWPAGTVITFVTYLAVESETDDTWADDTACIIAGFEWTYTQDTGAQEQTESIPNPGDDDADLANGAIGNATEDHPDNGTADDGDFGDWEVITECELNECPSVIDCVYTTTDGVTFSESSWTSDGEEIGTTHEGGVTPEPGEPEYDKTYLPVAPNDWHWSVTFEWQETVVEVSVWIENFDPDDAIEVEIICSEQYVDQPLMLMVDVNNDSYALTAADVPVWDGAWSAYPFDIPPDLGFELTGAARANTLDCDPDAFCPADLNGDGKVGGADLGLLLANWVSTEDIEKWDKLDRADFNCDLLINGADLGFLLGAWNPCPCGGVDLFQHADESIVLEHGVSCYDEEADLLLETAWVRSFDLAQDPDTVNMALLVHCVDVGIETNSGGNLFGAVNIYLDVDGGPPLAPGLDLLLLGTTPVLIRGEMQQQLVQAHFDTPVEVPPNVVMVVELALPDHYDGAIFPGFNGAGETAPTYIRAASCDVPEYLTMLDIGFPEAHWVMHVRGDLLPPIYPLENRGMADVEIVPGSEPGLWDVMATWAVETAEVGPPKDLGTIVTVLVNGDEIVSEDHTVQIETAPTAECMGSPPPCNPLWNCPDVVVDGVVNPGVCLSSLSPELFVCVCTNIVISDINTNIPLAFGDTVTVALAPLPGSLPETATSDDQLSVIFEPEPPAENRAMVDILFAPGPAPDLWNVTASWRAENGTIGFKDLGTDVLLEVNGQPISATPVTVTTEGSGTDCMGSTPPCDPLWYCDPWTVMNVTGPGICTNSLLPDNQVCLCVCPIDVELAIGTLILPGDLVTVALVPAPGALPETETSDDELTVVFAPPPPPANRAMIDVTYAPGEVPGLWNITADFLLENIETNVPQDLSTDFMVEVNQVPIGIYNLDALTESIGDDGCTGLTPPCPDGNCPDFLIAGEIVPGECGIFSIPTFAMCACSWPGTKQVIDNVLLNPGDMISVTMLAAPGSVNETVTYDDSVTVQFIFEGCGGGGDCFIPHDTPGCDDVVCCTTVCAIDPICCETAWDASCVAIALAECIGR